MLILSRKAGEQIVINDNITVTLVRVGPGKVRIGIEAPKDVDIQRFEILDRSSKGESNPEAQKRPDSSTC